MAHLAVFLTLAIRSLALLRSIFTGLAVGLAFTGGMFNIGAEGQLLMGAIASAVFGFLFPGMPWFIYLPLTVAAGALTAGIWGSIPGILKAKKGVHEVIATIMMNYLALNIGGYVVEKLRDGQMAQTPAIAEAAAYPRLSVFIKAFEGSNVNFGFILAVLMALVIYFVIFKTVFGYEVTAMGLNSTAAEDGGVERVLGVHHTYLSGISTNFGFEGIAVALLANNNPIGIIFSAILFGALASGGQYMNLAADVPVDIIGIIQGLIILFAASRKAFDFLKNKKSKAVVS